MRFTVSRVSLALLLLSITPAVASSMERHATDQVTDPLAWLNEPHGERALAWAKAENERTLERLATDARYKRYYRAALEVLQDESHFPGSDQSVALLHKGWVYNVLRNEGNPQGLWRRTLLSSFRTASPKWEILLDIDALSRAEGRKWALSLARFAPGETSACMIAMSEKGWGKIAWREFDLSRRRFVPNGFDLPEVPFSSVAWKDANTLFVASDFGPGSTGMLGPVLVKQWSRGMSLADAPVVLGPMDKTAQLASVSSAIADTGAQLVLAQIVTGRNEATHFVYSSAKRFERATLPLGAVVAGVYRDRLIVQVDNDWVIGAEHWPGGSVLSMRASDITKAAPAIDLVTKPSSPRQRISRVQVTAAGVIVYDTDNGRGRMWRFTRQGSSWISARVSVGDEGQIAPAVVMDDPTIQSAFVLHQNFVQAPAMYEVDVANNRATKIKSTTPQFDANRYVTEQLEALSRDGTRVPYFVVRQRAFDFDSDAPTLLHGYGAYGGPQYIQYGGILGRLWLEQGGVYVLATIRGGGEFGEAWHVTRTQRQHTYDDFIAIAEDLIRRKVTRAGRLGVFGYSAGGLLGGVAITQRPDLFSAAFLLAPVLDQLRPDLLGTAPETQIPEFGSPVVPGEREFLERTSPFQNLHKRSDFPVPFIYSNTSDTNVYPAQGRRFAAKMASLEMPRLYYEAREGGHNFGATVEDIAKGNALAYVYLAQRLIDPPPLSAVNRTDPAPTRHD